MEGAEGKEKERAGGKRWRGRKGEAGKRVGMVIDGRPIGGCSNWMLMSSRDKKVGVRGGEGG